MSHGRRGAVTDRRAKGADALTRGGSASGSTNHAFAFPLFSRRTIPLFFPLATAVASMADLFGPPPLEHWPEPLRFLYEERWRIRFWEAGQDEEAAKAAALVEVWESRGTE